MANINLGVALNFDDSNYKKGVKSVEQSLKKFSTSTAFVKLKLDDSDFRKQYQDIVKESIKNIEKSDALSYRTKGGKLKKADSIGTMQTAYKYNLEQSVNSQLSKKEQNLYAKRAEYLQAHLNLIKAIGLETNSQLKAQAQIAAMPARLAQARRSGEVAAAKSKAAKEISALEKEKQLKKEIYAIDKKLDANAKSDKSEKAKLEEEVRLLSMKVKFLREQDKLAGIPQATPSAELEQTQKRLNQVKAIQRLNTLYNTQNGILTRLRNVAGRYFSLYGIIRFGQKVAEITGYYQKQQIALEGILGSATKAQSAINQLKQKALESPFMVKQLVTYTKQLAAFGIEYDNLIPTVSKLADVSVGLGVDMDRIILAYGQVKSATVLRGQELRQFTEAGIPMVEELAKKFTALNGELVTTADIFDLISKRQVSFDMVQKVMSDLTSEGGKFYKMQENITNTLAGQIEKLKDIWDAELNRIGEESGNVFTGIVKFLQQIAKNTKSVSWAMMVMIPTSYIVREFARIKMEFMKLDAARQAQAGNMWKHAFKMGSLLRGIGGLAITAGLGVAVGLIAKAIDNATRLRKELEKVGEAFNKETTKMISGLDSLTKKITAAKIGTKEYNDAVETLATNYGDFISTDIIKALQSQGDAAHQTAMEFATIAENVKAAIKELQQFKELEAKKETVKEAFVKDKTSTAFFQNQLDYRVKYSDVTKAAFKKEYGRDGEGYELVSFWDEAFDNAVKEFANAPIHSKDKFNEIFSEIIEDTFSGISESDKKEALRAGWMAVENKTTSIFSPDTLQELMDARNRVQNSDYYKIDNALKKVDLSKVTGTPKEQYIANEKAYRDVLTQTGEGSIHNIMSNIVNSQDEDHIENAKKAFENLYKTLNNGDKTARDIAEDFNNLYNAIGDPDDRNKIVRIGEWYEKNTGPMTKKEDQLAERMDATTKFKNDIVKVDGEDKSIQEYFDKWNPYARRDKTIQQTQDEIYTEYNSLKERKGRYVAQGKEGLFKDEIALIDAKMRVLETLATNKYYSVNLDYKNGGGNKNKYEKIRITDFMNELLSLTTKAEDATKKIVGVTGYTGELGEFVEGLKPGNFLKGFFEEGGNPFEEILGKMSEFGVTDFLPNLNAESLKAIFKNAGWEEGKEMSVPDFRAIYENVIKEVGGQALEGLKKKRETVAKDSPEYNSINAAIDALQENQIRALENMTARWDSDEIEKKLESMIKELTDINGNFEKQKSQRDMFERIGKAGSYRDAQNAIYGKGSTPLRFDKTFAARNTALSLLGAEGGQGVASTYAGQRLTNLLSGGHLNIENLNALTDIMYDLEEQAAEMDVLSKAEGSEEAKKNAKQFGDVTKSITQIIKEMVDSIISDYEELSKYRSSDMVAGDDIVKAKNDFQTANDLINNFINQRLVDITNAYNKGEIDIDEFDRQVSNTNHEADKMRIKATQDLYNTMLTNLGGQKLPDWIIALFSENNGTTGISQGGKAMSIMNAISGQGGGIESLVAMGVQKKLEKGEYDKAEDPEAAAAEAAQKIIATIKAVGSVFSIVDQAVQAAVEMGKGVIDALNATDNRLGLTKWADGAMYDKDGNLNIDEEYYEKQNRRDTAMQVMNTIGNFSSGISGAFKSFMSGDFIGAFTGVFNSITTLISDIAGTRDSQIRYQQEALVRSNENLARSMEGLEDALEDAAGVDKYDVQSQQIANLQQQKQQYDMLLALENEKKNADSAKAQDYTDQAVEAQRQIDEIMDNIQDDVLGTADQLASTLTDPLVDAFRNGENAARAWRDAVKSYVSDVLKDILMTKVVAPKIQEILDQFMGDNTSSDDILSLFKDEEKVGGLVDSLNDVGTGLIDDFNNLPSSIKDLIGFNSEQSSLSGGISGITEDTARQLEGLANSMLMQQIIGNSHLASMSSHLIATIQISWFNGMLEQAKATRIAAENLDRAISDMRNGIRPMSVTMV